MGSEAWQGQGGVGFRCCGLLAGDEILQPLKMPGVCKYWANSRAAASEEKRMPDCASWRQAKQARKPSTEAKVDALSSSDALKRSCVEIRASA